MNWMSSSKKDHEGVGVAKGKPSFMKAAAVSEEKTPRSPQKQVGSSLPLTITMNIFIALIMRFIVMVNVMVNVMDCLPACKITEVRMGNYSLIWSGLTTQVQGCSLRTRLALHIKAWLACCKCADSCMFSNNQGITKIFPALPLYYLSIK